MPLKTTVDIDGRIEDVDTVEYAGGLWLVPGWKSDVGRWRRPSHLIRIDTLPHQEDRSGHYRLKVPLPRDLFDPNFSVWSWVPGYEVGLPPYEMTFPMPETVQ